MDVPVVSSRQLRVLLVDDDDDTRSEHVNQLRAQGYEVTATHDSESGLALAQGIRPEMIFLHLVRGGSPAVSFLQKLRADDTMRHVPVSMVAGQGSRRLKKLGLSAVKGDDW